MSGAGVSHLTANRKVVDTNIDVAKQTGSKSTPKQKMASPLPIPEPSMVRS